VKPVAVFYHAYLPGIHPAYDYDTYMSQIAALSDSLLLFKADRVTINIFGDAPDVPVLNKGNITLLRHKASEAKSEADTLRLLKEYSDTNDGYVLYFHTKGITRGTKQCDSWREYMQYYCIKNWKDAVKVLENGFDTYGVAWFKTNDSRNIQRHYSGNFWWSTTDHIKKLSCITSEMYTSDKRWDSEWWITKIPTKVFVAHQVYKDMYEYVTTWDHTHHNTEFNYMDVI